MVAEAQNDDANRVATIVMVLIMRRIKAVVLVVMAVRAVAFVLALVLLCAAGRPTTPCALVRRPLGTATLSWASCEFKQIGDPPFQGPFSQNPKP